MSNFWVTLAKIIGVEIATQFVRKLFKKEKKIKVRRSELEIGKEYKVSCKKGTILGLKTMNTLVKIVSVRSEFKQDIDYADVTVILENGKDNHYFFFAKDKVTFYEI